MTEREIFLAALDLPCPAERGRFLHEVCGPDLALRKRVEALLSLHDNAGSFLGAPLVEPLSFQHEATHEVARGQVLPKADEDLGFLSAATRPDSLGRLGHYEVLEVLGKGGFGIVFRAFDDVLQRVVAVKVLSPQMAATSPARKRFLREAQGYARVRHENVVQVYAIEEKPLPYLVMEFIPGETLQQRLDRMGPLDPIDTIGIARQLAEGLAAAHDTGLIHRDIKPANILLESTPQPRVKITDFGLARAADDASLTQSGMVAGTPMFMSPEQAKGETLDHRADLFSLGSVLYTMCTGRPPFRANTTLAVLKRVAEDTPRSIREIIPEVPHWLCDLISRLHAKNPEERFASAREVAALLERAQKDWPADPAAPVVAAEPSRTTEHPKAIRPARRLLRWAVTALALVVLLGGFALTEATGVTRVRGTVIRLFSAEGTLVLEVDDPGVSVAVEGKDVVITGAGVKEIRLQPGQYQVEATKDGKVVSRELVSVERKGRRVIRVSVEPKPKPTDLEARKDGDWEKSVGKLTPEEQVKAVLARLKALDPGFTGRLEHAVEDGKVVRLSVEECGVSDLTPVRALAALQSFTSRSAQPKLNDLSPLRGLPLTELVLHNSGVSDLTPLAGMKLTHLDLTGSKVANLTSLRGMPLTILSLPFSSVKDISPLAGMKLDWLNLDSTAVIDLSPLEKATVRTLYLQNTEVSDLKPLAKLPLQHLNCAHTKVTDLSALKGMKLVTLYLDGTKVTDLSPLKGMPLTHFNCRDCSFEAKKAGDVLRSLGSLESINGEPVADFLKALDGK